MKTPLSDLNVIISSFADEQSATKVVQQLIQEKMAACGTILSGARSIYWWQGKIEEASEVVVIFKTTQAMAASCRKLLAELHPYEVPEIFSFESSAAGEPYLAWLNQVVKAY